jgi:hypothetical protein
MAVRAPIPTRPPALGARQEELNGATERVSVAESGLEQIGIALEQTEALGINGLITLATQQDAPISPSFQAYLRRLLELPGSRA